MIVLGIETSCDETGVALYDAGRGLALGAKPIVGLLAHSLHSQVELHDEYGGVVPELASRDHIRRLLPLVTQVMAQAELDLDQISAVAYTQGPGLAGTLLVGASVAASLAFGLGIPSIGIHHLEGHLLSPLLSPEPPGFPFVALLVSGGHTQLMRVSAVGDYTLLGETRDDAVGEAFDKTAKLLGLPYPGGAALAELARSGRSGLFHMPRPMIASGDLDFSFSGLKTAVVLLARQQRMDTQTRADVARAFEEAAVDVLVTKCIVAVEETGLDQVVVAGGVGANRSLRTALDAAGVRKGFRVCYPPLEFCTDNGAMIALAGALRLQDSGFRIQDSVKSSGFTVKPRWELQSLAKVDTSRNPRSPIPDPES